jgi:hypothetical protein
MTNKKQFSAEINLNNDLVSFFFEEFGSSHVYKVYNKNGVFDAFKMKQNTYVNPQEYIFYSRAKIPNEILKIEKELGKIIQKHRE